MIIDADYIRKFASDHYIKPARARGEENLQIGARHVENDLKKIGLPRGRTPLVCSVLRGKKFQQENGVVLDRWTGPESGQSPTVVFHFRLGNGGTGEKKTARKPESSEERARRLTERIRGLMKEEIAAHGGAKNFLRWVRSDEEAA